MKPPVVLLLVALSTPAAFANAATPLPEPVRLMIEKAAASGNEGKITAVVSVAKETNPDSTAEIDAIVSHLKQQREAERIAHIQDSTIFENWKGSGELGGSFSTGNSDAVTLAVGLKLIRDGIDWRHNVSALADLQRSKGVNTQERYLLGYQADWKFSDNGYLWGRLGWERNQVAGLTSRFTEALGVGYVLANTPAIRFSVEGGPALSQTRLITGEYENLFGGRLAGNFRWNWSPITRFTQDAFLLVDNTNGSFQSNTALTTKLMGALSARVSFSVQHETNPPNGRENTDTITRATLVYDF